MDSNNIFAKKTQEEMISKLKEMVGVWGILNTKEVMEVANCKVIEVFSYEIENNNSLIVKLKFENEDHWTDIYCNYLRKN